MTKSPIPSREPPPEASLAHRPRSELAAGRSEGKGAARSHAQPPAGGEHGEHREDATLPDASTVASCCSRWCRRPPRFAVIAPLRRLSALRRDRLHLQQIWHGHLLSGALLSKDGNGSGLFAIFYPAHNLACARAVSGYRECIQGEAGFDAHTLEEVAAAIRLESRASWIDEFIDRYLDLGKIEQASLIGEPEAINS